MDTLVAHYSRPAFEEEGYSHHDQNQLAQVTPSLSLNFTLPPLANVSGHEPLHNVFCCCLRAYPLNPDYSLLHFCERPQTTIPIQTAPSNLRTEPQLLHFDFRVVS